VIDWIETTLRKGTKLPKICRDMFITDSRGKLSLVTVANGRLKSRFEIGNIQLMELVNSNNLIERSTLIFQGCSTYRTKKGWEAVDFALEHS